MDEHATGGLTLAEVADHGIAVVEVWVLGWVESTEQAVIQLQRHAPSSIVSIVPSSPFTSLTSPEGAVRCTRSPNEKERSCSR
jgi:hypothetical protein